MFNQFFQELSYQILLEIQHRLAEWVRDHHGGSTLSPDTSLPENLKEMGRLYFDIKNLAIHGIPLDHPPVINPNAFNLGANDIQERLSFNQGLLLSMLNNSIGFDPTPQTNITTLLSDKSVQLASAKGMLRQFEKGVEGLRNEVSRLEYEVGDEAFESNISERLDATAGRV